MAADGSHAETHSQIVSGERVSGGEGEGVWEPESRTTGEHGPQNHLSMASRGSESEVTVTGPVWVCARFSVYVMAVGLLTVGAG